MASSPTFTLLGARLRVASLARSRAFYAGVLGLEPHAGRPGELLLRLPGATRPLLTLVETPGAPPAPAEAPGLFHLAFLVPDRPALARVLRRLAEAQVPLAGLSDHGVSEAIYLSDPDGNGLEIYVDRPRAEWPSKAGKLEMYTRHLDVPNLLATDPAAGAAGLPSGTRLGHVHLRVGSLAEAERFFTGTLGLDVTVRGYPGALFFAADGYHHHVGANTWGVRPGATTAGAAGLDAVYVSAASATAPRTVLDPDGNRFEIAPP